MRWSINSELFQDEAEKNLFNTYEQLEKIGREKLVLSRLPRFSHRDDGSQGAG